MATIQTVTILIIAHFIITVLHTMFNYNVNPSVFELVIPVVVVAIALYYYISESIGVKYLLIIRSCIGALDILFYLISDASSRFEAMSQTSIKSPLFFNIFMFSVFIADVIIVYRLIRKTRSADIHSEAIHSATTVVEKVFFLVLNMVAAVVGFYSTIMSAGHQPTLELAATFHLGFPVLVSIFILISIIFKTKINRVWFYILGIAGIAPMPLTFIYLLLTT